MRRAAIIICAALVGCSPPSDYAPQSVELDILDTLTVVFLEPGFVLSPVTVQRAVADEFGLPVLVEERWEPQYSHEERGVWIMVRKTLSQYPMIVGNEDRRLYGR